jgi:hypothetical protein
MTPEELRKMLQNPQAADWSKLKASDVGYSMGKPMTEAEMKAYCQANGIQQPTIMKKNK